MGCVRYMVRMGLHGSRCPPRIHPGYSHSLLHAFAAQCWNAWQVRVPRIIEMVLYFL